MHLICSSIYTLKTPDYGLFSNVFFLVANTKTLRGLGQRTGGATHLLPGWWPSSGVMVEAETYLLSAWLVAWLGVRVEAETYLRSAWLGLVRG